METDIMKKLGPPKSRGIISGKEPKERRPK